MDLFNRKKLIKLKLDNIALEERIANLENIIENNGWKIPAERRLVYREDNKWLLNTHFNAVVNAMNYFNIEVINAYLKENEGVFVIEYRLPPEIKRASFDLHYSSGGGKNRTHSYKRDFKVEFTDGKELIFAD